MNRKEVGGTSFLINSHWGIGEGAIGLNEEPKEILLINKLAKGGRK